MILKQKEFWTIPNILSLSRLLFFPVLLILLFDKNEKYFVILFTVSLATDILDGFIARRFNMQTKIGARLDSLADNGVYIAAVLGVFIFKYSDFQAYLHSFILFLALFLLTLIFSLIKFGKLPSLHLYSFKIAGYLQGSFFLLLFLFGFFPSYYYIMVTWSYFAFIEHLTVQVILTEMQNDQKSLYHVLKKRKKKKKEKHAQ